MGELKQEMTISIQLQNCLANEVDVQSSRVLNEQDIHKDLLERELESVGIRLNQRPPNIYFKQKTGGGLHFNSTCALTYVDEKLVRTILHEYKVNI